jgi:uracil phosphoribosyltransferase
MQNVYTSKHPLIAHKLAKLRDVNTDPRKDAGDRQFGTA